MSQEITHHRRTRGPLKQQTVGGRVMLRKRAAAERLAISVPHLNRLLRQKKLNLNVYHFYDGGPGFIAEDEIEALSRGAFSTCVRIDGDPPLRQQGTGLTKMRWLARSQEISLPF